MSEPELSIVVPVFDEEECLPELYSRVVAAMEGAAIGFELLFVNDGSRDRSLAIMAELHANDGRVSVLDLSRNFGHQLAITAGLDHARGAAVVVIDADLQDPPEVIPKLVERWRDGFDVVYGVREHRAGESSFKLGTAWVFYRLMRLFTAVDLPESSGDFRLLSRRAVEAMRSLRERNRFVRGMVRWIGYRQTGVLYRRDARFRGETKYPLWKMTRLATDAVVSFSTIPLRMSILLGLAVSVTCFGYAVYTVGMHVFANSAVHGWASLMVAILLIGGMQLVCVGILGEYVARIYDEVRGRPLYLVGDLKRRDGSSGTTRPSG